jgi:hypothetical protein
MPHLVDFNLSTDGFMRNMILSLGDGIMLFFYVLYLTCTSRGTSTCTCTMFIASFGDEVTVETYLSLEKIRYSTVNRYVHTVGPYGVIEIYYIAQYYVKCYHVHMI